jgi:hypothetical protein
MLNGKNYIQKAIWGEMAVILSLPKEFESISPRTDVSTLQGLRFEKNPNFQG